MCYFHLKKNIWDNFNTYKVPIEDKDVVERDITYLHQSVSQHEWICFLNERTFTFVQLTLHLHKTEQENREIISQNLESRSSSHESNQVQSFY